MQPDDPRAPENRVIRFREVCQIAGISQKTMRRLCERGEGPKLLRLSQRCLGVRRVDLEAWFAGREQIGPDR
ncbi:helix-turn-helix domain-containing protein [Methylorubrum extorquens]|uniref:helix-turn-helix transcriptional regulator n=1 Tax=Methylorubrum extorquens TaxID=408 RepID=UPI0009B5D5A0